MPFETSRPTDRTVSEERYTVVSPGNTPPKGSPCLQSEWGRSKCQLHESDIIDQMYRLAGRPACWSIESQCRIREICSKPCVGSSATVRAQDTPLKFVKHLISAPS